MSGVNKVILVGNLGADPTVRYTQGGTAVANFSLATTERFTTREGERESRVEWHRIVAWGKLAEICKEYLKKGRSAYVEGRIQTRSYDDREGNKKWITEIVASRVQFLGGRGEGDRSGGGQSASETEMPETAAVSEPLVNQEDDDLPF